MRARPHLGQLKYHNIYTYTNLLEFSTPGNSFGISEDTIMRTEVHKHLQRLAGAVCSEYKKTKGGRQNQELSKKSKKFHIYEGQTADLMELRKENELIKDELQKWKKGYCDLETELKKTLPRNAGDNSRKRQRNKQFTNSQYRPLTLHKLKGKLCLKRQTYFRRFKEIQNIKILFVKGTVSPLVCHILWTGIKKPHSQEKQRQVEYIT